MSLYHSFRKTGKKKEISNRPRSGPIPAYYMPTPKQGCKKASLFCWCARRESNPRPSHSECATLSPELLAQNIQYIYIINFALVKDKFFDRHRKDSSAEYDKSLILFSKAGEEKTTLSLCAICGVC